MNRPYTSPWGAIQRYKTTYPGVFEVSTAGHGGIMVNADIAEGLFSPAAIKCGFGERGYICFEEDCDAAVVIRELLDKGLWKIPTYFKEGKDKYEEVINTSIIHWNPEYWESRGNKLPLEILKKRLIERVEADFSDYANSLVELDKQGFLDEGKKMSAVSDANTYLKEHEFSYSEAQYLLQFQNPLIAVTDHWLKLDGVPDISSVIRDMFNSVIEYDNTDKEVNMAYYDINETAARRAKEANSFREYKPGSLTSGYREMVDEAIAIGEAQKKRVDPMYHEKIDYWVDRYARKLAENLNERSAIDARVPSIMIAGGSNFPTRKKHKQNAARDRNMGEYQYIEGLLNKIRSTGTGGISADDSMAVEKLQSKLDGLKAAQESMKAVNEYYRFHKTLDGCPDLSADVIETLKESMSRHWRQNSVPFPSYSLSNNSANIRATQQRIDELKNRAEFAGWTFEGGSAEANVAENRLQLFFDDKPTEEQRKELKGNGFKFAPSQNNAWQRQLTKNAIHSAGYIDFIKPDTGQKPYELQPYNRKAETSHDDR